MTRSRALAGGVPSELAIEYYAQRASAGLIITEGTAPSAVGLGYARTPAIDTPEQIAAWKKITAAVHAKGGRMFMQFMHVGRIAHSANRYTDEPPVAPSASAPPARCGPTRRPAGLRHAARARARARSPASSRNTRRPRATRSRPGFDGVELHSASGYLPMQFCPPARISARTDTAAASNRIRFVVEALEAMIAAAGGVQPRSASRSARRCRSTTSTTTTRSRPTRRS